MSTSPQTPEITLLPTELSFLKSLNPTQTTSQLQTRIQALLRSISTGSSTAYTTILTLNWLSPQIQLHPAYSSLNLTFRDPYPPRVLELGVCFGTDTRRLILDGLPAGNITVTDLTGDYWDLGREFFDDKERIGGVKTVFCDAAAEDRVELDEFKERFDWAISFLTLHVFGKEASKRFLERVFGVVAPGGSFMGTSVGWRGSEDGVWEVRGEKRWIYCKEGLERILKEVGFGEVKVEETRLGERMEARSKEMAGKEAEGGKEKVTWSFVAKKVLPEWASC